MPVFLLRFTFFIVYNFLKTAVCHQTKHGFWNISTSSNANLNFSLDLHFWIFIQDWYRLCFILTWLVWMGRPRQARFLWILSTAAAAAAALTHEAQLETKAAPCEYHLSQLNQTIITETYAVLLVRCAGQHGWTLHTLHTVQCLWLPCRRVVQGHGCAWSWKTQKHLDYGHWRAQISALNLVLADFLFPKSGRTKSANWNLSHESSGWHRASCFIQQSSETKAVKIQGV